MPGRRSNQNYWGQLPMFRPDGMRVRYRINYERIPIPPQAHVDPSLVDLWSQDLTRRLACRKRLWRRLRTGFYDRQQAQAQAARNRIRDHCGARCRDGHLCRAKAAWNRNMGKQSNRCRMHGGASTGPRTEAGKAASLAALARARASRRSRAQ